MQDKCVMIQVLTSGFEQCLTSRTTLVVTSLSLLPAILAVYPSIVIMIVRKKLDGKYNEYSSVLCMFKKIKRTQKQKTS